MNILVAGASGVIGREVVRMLVEAGHRVRTLSQNAERAEPLKRRTSDVRVLDATDASAVAGVCEEIEVVVSALGAPVLPGSARRSYGAVDLEANRHLLAEAKRAGVRRFVYVGVYTTAAYAGTTYARVHTEVERLVKVSGLEYAVVRSTGVFGALAELVRMAGKGRVPLIGDGSARTNPVHESDVADAVIRAVTGPPSTEVDVGGPEVLTRRRIAELAFAAHSKPPRLVALPVWLMRFVGFCFALVNRRMADLLAFVIPASTTDCVAPQAGTRTLGPYFDRLVREGP